MSVTVKSSTPSVWHSTTAPNGLVVARSPHSGDEYVVIARAAYFDDGIRTYGIGLKAGSLGFDPTILRLDSAHLNGWTWRYARPGDELRVAA